MTFEAVPVGGRGATAPNPATTEPGRYGRLRAALAGAAWTASAGLLSLGIAAWNLRLWQADLRVPLFGLGSDATLTSAVVKGLVENTWIWNNPNLGAPDGIQFFDYPAAFGDTLSIATMKLMGFVSDDPILVVNSFYLIGFPLAAVAAFWVLRSLGIGSAVSLVCAVLFAVLPAHFTRGIAHLGLATYWAVPLGAWLVFGAAGLHPLLSRRVGATGVTAWLSRRTVATALLLLLLGLSGLYYALFAVMLIVLVGLVYFMASRRRDALAAALVVAAALLAVVVVQQLPALLYAQENGRNAAVAERTAAESEIYGLKLAQVLFPSANHRLAPFGALGREYADATSSGEGLNANLGILLGVTLVVSVFWLLVVAARGGSRAGPEQRLMTASGLSALVAVLLATVGGGGTLFSFLLTSQIRAWNRISVYLAFFAVVALALLLTWAGRRLLARGVPPAFCGVGLAVVAVLGVLDQTTSPKIDYAGIKESWRSNVRFVVEIGDRVPAGGKILQLPYVPFPENPPVANMADYDLAIPYLADRKGLNWSYGEIKGRPTDWADDLSRRPIRELVYGAAAAGFAGIYVDRDGYVDDGRRVIRQIGAVVGPGNEIQSSDGRAVFFDLQGLKAEIDAQRTPAALDAVAAAVLEPVSVEPSEGFSPFEVSGGERRSWGDRKGQLRLENPGGSAVGATITMRLAGPSDAQATTITVRCPGSRPATVRVTSVEARSISIRSNVPPGGLTCLLEAEGPAGPVTREDPRPKFQMVIDPQVSTAGLDELTALAAKGR